MAFLVFNIISFLFIHFQILISILILLTSNGYSGDKTTHFINFTFITLGSYITYLIHNITSTYWVELNTKVRHV